MYAKSLNLLGNEANNFYQVGINLGDPIFRGVYHGKQAHDDDLGQVVQRALDVGCTKLMVTGSDLKESAHAIELAKQFRTQQRCWRSASQLIRNPSWHLLRYGGRPPVLDKTIRREAGRASGSAGSTQIPGHQRE